MGYTIIDNQTGQCLPIRLIADRQPSGAQWLMFQVCDLVQPREWSCEPCNLPTKRYRIVWQSGVEEYRPWWEVIAPDDDTRDIAAKLSQAAAVKSAYLKYEQARHEYTRVAGRSPEIMEVA